MDQQVIFQRSILLFGENIFNIITKKKIILFGVGGVGSWCAEALVRSGVRYLTLVDSDDIDWTNINRQLPATIHTVGRPKVEVMREHLLTINPEAQILTRRERYTEKSASSFRLESYDYVIDAIDSIGDKAHLIRSACETSASLFSSMGAALKLDPTRIRIAGFRKVTHDPLARALRRRFREEGFPSREFLCVYSEERLRNAIPHPANGTAMHLTASFGLALAGMVFDDIVKS